MILEGAKIGVIGATGQVAKPITLALAAANEVTGIARFSDADARAELEAAGVACIPVDLVEPDFSDVPDDVDYVLNLAVTKTGDFDRDLAANAEATGLLMAHCRSAKAFLHCSSTAVYEPNGHERLAETDPLGDNHRCMMPTYSLCKIAAEAMARFRLSTMDNCSFQAHLSLCSAHGAGAWIIAFTADDDRHASRGLFRLPGDVEKTASHSVAP